MKTKIKVRQSDNEIIEVQSHPSHRLIAGEGEFVEDYEGPRPFAGMIREARNQARNKTPEEREVPKTPRELRLAELKAKPTLTLQEVTEVLKLNNLI